MTEELKQALVENFRIVGDAMGISKNPRDRAAWVKEQIVNKTPVARSVLSNAAGV